MAAPVALTSFTRLVYTSVMRAFICNICGTRNEIAAIDAELASCPCGSNVRMRALIHLLSVELFGVSLTLLDFPRLKSIRGLGMTDNRCYARTLAEKFDYTNTFYDHEPRLDVTTQHPELYGKFDFILSADVLEHIAPPLDRALVEISALLQPSGFLVATTPCPQPEKILEHFPELHQYRVVTLGNTPVLINRRRDGAIEVSENLSFHGGPGSTLEMRQANPAALGDELLRNNFKSVEFLTGDVADSGIVFTQDVSQPLVARKDKFQLPGSALPEFVDLWRQTAIERDHFKHQVQMASTSRWVKLGRKLGIGPGFKL